MSSPAEYSSCGGMRGWGVIRGVILINVNFWFIQCVGESYGALAHINMQGGAP